MICYICKQYVEFLSENKLCEQCTIFRKKGHIPVKIHNILVSIVIIFFTLIILFSMDICIIRQNVFYIKKQIEKCK